MNSKYFLALVGLAVAQSSSALTVTIDGETINNVNRVVIEGGNDSGSPGGGSEPGGGGGSEPGGGGGSEPGGGGNSDKNDPVNRVCGGGGPDAKVLYRKEMKTGLEHYYFRRGEGYTFSFNGQEGDAGSISYMMSTRKGNGETTKIATIAPCRGQFDKDYVMQNVGYFCTRRGKEGTIYYKFSESGNVPLVYCPLDPDKTYYFNIRNYSPIAGEDSCPPGQLCGFGLNVIHY